MNSPSSEETIFAGALRLPPEQRAAYLDHAVGSDVALRQRIERLLKASEQAGGFLEEPAAPAADKATVLAVPLTEKAGDKIGRYKLLQQIGEGGCGVVYMAEQEEPVLRRVALKLIKLGMDTKQVIARFEAERQALAMMDHPNIARVLDAGATDTGRPYFVMELVRGVKITEYCDHNNLSTRERLDLFTKVCQAIQHAHQKGIIHRDIKPSNILVTLHDGVPVPKVIDFGIAKATQGRLTNKTLFTAFEQFIGTPAYVSPEQAEMSGLDIDTRSDIYSLGVLLYELLTGKTPFDASELLKAGFDQMRRTICEKEPDRPSTKLSTMVEGELTSTAKRRHTDAPKLISAVRGDLDWIVMKCLEKDRARRYESANGLASDILRHVNNEPVVACPPSAAYRFQKLVRRNKLVFTATAAVTAALLIGLAVSTWMFFQEREAKGQQARLRLQAQAKEQEAQTARANEKKLRLQAQANEKKAETEAAKSAQVAQFLKDMLSGVRPEVALGRDTSILREILDNTAKRVGKELQDQPEVHASLLNIIGSTYHGIGEYAQGEAMQRQALALWRRTRGNESAEVADSLCHLGSDFFEEGKASAMETVVRESLEIRMKLFRSDSREVADCLAELGLALEREGKLTEAETVQQKALTMRRKLFGEDHEDVAFSLNALGNVLRSQHRLVESEEMYRKALDMRQRLLGKEGGSSTQRNLAMVLADEGKFAEAERHMREAADLTRKRLGKDHPAAVAALRSLAGLLKSQGKTTEAEPLYREVLERYAKLADQGKAEAQFFIGAMYAHGEGLDKDMIEAIKWYGKAAEQGNPAAQYLLGSIYHNGSDVATNLVEAFNWWRKAAEQGIADAQYDLGVMYEQGKGVTKDLTQAVQWYRKAADQGDAGAQYNVANFYQNGKGVPKDIAEALKWYRLSADQGHSPAQNNLGVMYLEGQGVEKNPVEAAGWYRKAAEQSNEVAQCNLAGMYLRGDGVQKDAFAAALWYRKSAEQGNPKAQGLLGVLYHRGEGIPKDDVEAAKWIRKAAEQGDPEAQRNLGIIFQHGYGVGKDPSETAKWFRRAAEQGEKEAQLDLGLAYYRGDGVAQDAAKALYWWRKAADQGSARGEFNLAIMYERGEGVTKDLAEAIKRYRTAADRGHTDAQCKLGILYRGGEGVEKDPVEAVKWFRKAADKGDAPAQRNLAQMYERGEGVAKDPAEALRWRHKASESGDANDLNNLAWLLATSPHPEERNGREAVDYAEKAVAATSRTNAAYLDTLAAAYAETGDFAKAVTIQKEALALCNDESLKKELIFHLKLYESKKPCREP